MYHIDSIFSKAFDFHHCGNPYCIQPSMPAVSTLRGQRPCICHCLRVQQQKGREFWIVYTKFNNSKNCYKILWAYLPLQLSVCPHVHPICFCVIICHLSVWLWECVWCGMVEWSLPWLCERVYCEVAQKLHYYARLVTLSVGFRDAYTKTLHHVCRPVENTVTFVALLLILIVAMTMMTHAFI